jgi:short-subunit dehydrogenase
VITGATDGIGREFAVQLAKAGFGVMLVSRSQNKLDDLAREIGKHSTQWTFSDTDYVQPTNTRSQQRSMLLIFPDPNPKHTHSSLRN